MMLAVFCHLLILALNANVSASVVISDEIFVYAYDKRMCYFDTLIEKF